MAEPIVKLVQKQIGIHASAKLAIQEFSKYLNAKPPEIAVYEASHSRQIAILENNAYRDVLMVPPNKKVAFVCVQGGEKTVVEFEIKKVFNAGENRALHHFWLKEGVEEVEYITSQTTLYTK